MPSKFCYVLYITENILNENNMRQRYCLDLEITLGMHYLVSTFSFRDAGNWTKIYIFVPASGQHEEMMLILKMPRDITLIENLQWN